MRLFKRREKSDAGISSAEWALSRMGDKPSDRDAEAGKVNLTLTPEKGNKSWSYVAVNRITTTGAACPFQIMAGGKQVAEGNPLAKLLSNGNPLQNSVRLLNTTMLNLELWGQAYWKIERKGDRPVELWPIPSAQMAPGTMDQGLPVSWKYTGKTGTQVEVPARDIVWFRYASPGGAMDAMSPMSAAEAAVQCDLYALRYYSLFFERGADPLYAVSYPPDVTVNDETTEKLRAQWQQAYSGLKRFFKPIILSKGAKLEKLTSEPQMAYLKLREQWREEILAVWGVPPAVAGVYQYANYANTREQRKIFWQSCLQPKHAAMAADINSQLAPQMQGGGELVWDYSGIPELRPDLTEESNTALRTLTINETRARYFGLPEVEWGNVPAISATVPVAPIL